MTPNVNASTLGLIALLALGTAVSIDALKDLLPLRGWLIGLRLRKWIDCRAWITPVDYPGASAWNDSETSNAEDLGRPDPRTSQSVASEAARQLEHLLSAGDSLGWGRTGLYDLPVERLCGQIATGVEIAVASPVEFRELFQVLTVAKDVEHIKTVRKYVLISRGKARDEDESDRIESRARVAMYAQRSLDGLQAELARYWRRTMFWLCLIASAAWLLTAYIAHWQITESVLGNVLCAVAVALLAPVGHDLVRAIRSFRRA